MSFLVTLPDVRLVTVLKNEGGPDEQRIQVRAHIQPRKGFFEIDAPLDQGDVVETTDPRGGTRRLSVDRVEVYDFGPLALRHLEVTWQENPPVRVPAIRRIALEGLHSEIVAVSGALFADGHYSASIFEAFKAIELRVRTMSNVDATGQTLMGRAFDGAPPPISLATEEGQSGRDEQAGFKLMFMGAMTGIRNPKAHEAVVQDDPQRTLEYLAFASLLMRRLDDAER